MNMELDIIKLKLKWVNAKLDNTDRNVSLLEIAKMDYDQRKNLNFINDFHDRHYKFLNHFDINDSLEVHKQCDNIGYIHFCFTNHLGVFYEAIYECKEETLFNAIRKSYFNKLQELYPA